MIPFRDATTDDRAGLAAYLRFADEEGGRGIRSALFVVNARAEPIDFTFCRVDVPASFLWRPGEARRRAVAALIAVLFSACAQTPALILARAEEVHPTVFTEALLVELPLGRIADRRTILSSPEESPERLSDDLHLFWAGAPPAADSVARRTLTALAERRLLVEPFERAARGLEEAFATQ